MTGRWEVILGYIVKAVPVCCNPGKTELSVTFIRSWERWGARMWAVTGVTGRQLR